MFKSLKLTLLYHLLLIESTHTLCLFPTFLLTFLVLLSIDTNYERKINIESKIYHKLSYPVK